MSLRRVYGPKPVVLQFNLKKKLKFVIGKWGKVRTKQSSEIYASLGYLKINATCGTFGQCSFNLCYFMLLNHVPCKKGNEPKKKTA